MIEYVYVHSACPFCTWMTNKTILGLRSVMKKQTLACMFEAQCHVKYLIHCGPVCLSDSTMTTCSEIKSWFLDFASLGACNMLLLDLDSGELWQHDCVGIHPTIVYGPHCQYVVVLDVINCNFNSDTTESII